MRGVLAGGAQGGGGWGGSARRGGYRPEGILKIYSNEWREACSNARTSLQMNATRAGNIGAQVRRALAQYYVTL